MPGLKSHETSQEKSPPMPQEPEYVDPVEADKGVFEYDQSLLDSNLTAQAASPEALMVVNVTMHGPSGGNVMATVRGFDASQIVANIKELVGVLNHEFGLSTVPAGYKQNGNGNKPAQQQGQQQTQQGSGESDKPGSGTGVLNSIKIDPDGKTISFSVGSFLWPFSDKRGPEMVLRVFDPALGFTIEDLSTPRVYEPKDWEGILYVDWVRVYNPSREKYYYNIVRIHA